MADGEEEEIRKLNPQLSQWKIKCQKKLKITNFLEKRELGIAKRCFFIKFLALFYFVNYFDVQY